MTRRLCRITVTLTEGLSFLSAFLVPKANKNKICDTPCHSYHDRLLQSEKRLRRRIAKPSLIGIAPCRCSFPPRGTGFELELVRPAKNASLFSQLSLVLCVSRACLGKVIVVSTEGKGLGLVGTRAGTDTKQILEKASHTRGSAFFLCLFWTFVSNSWVRLPRQAHDESDRESTRFPLDGGRLSLRGRRRRILRAALRAPRRKTGARAHFHSNSVASTQRLC